MLLFLPVLFLLASCEGPLETDGYRCPEDIVFPDYNAFVEGGCESACDFGDLQSTNGDDFWTDLGITILKSVSSKLITFGVNTGISKAEAYFFGDDKETMRTLVGQFDKINKQMDHLLQLSDKSLRLLDEDRYNRLRIEFLKYKYELAAISNVNNEFIDRIKEDITEDELKKLIKEWGKTPVSGNAAKIELNHLLYGLSEFSYMYCGKQRNLFAVYDMIVFQNTPWENLGYDIRDAFRAYTASILAQTFYLTSIYYNYWDGGTAETQAELAKSAGKAIEFCESHGNQVERRSDAVCQIKEARLIIKSLVPMEKMLWPTVLQSFTFPQNQLKKSELNTIVTFYKNQGVSDDFTIIDCLNEGGLNFSKENNPKIVLAETKYSFSDYIFGRPNTSCTLTFSDYVENVPVKSYNKDKKFSVSYKNVSVYNYACFDMPGHFIVAPDGITRFDDFD